MVGEHDDFGGFVRIIEHFLAVKVPIFIRTYNPGEECRSSLALGLVGFHVR
jgi:hypothetical protein